MPLVEFENLSKIYRMGDETVRALDGVGLRIDPGEFVAILGPSGSGKSTLMHILGFMDSPSGGRLQFEGNEVGRISRAHRSWYRANRIGFVFQAFNLLPRLTVADNVVLPIVYSRSGIRDRNARAATALERVGMTHRATHIPSQLSGGERQRAAIARAIVNTPSLILADEPTGNLDSRNVDRIMELFTGLSAEGQTIVVVTHDEHVAGFARRTIRMCDGRISEDTSRPV